MEVAEIGPGAILGERAVLEGVGAWRLCRHGRAVAWGLFRPI
jgi:hypothetical protein